MAASKALKTWEDVQRAALTDPVLFQMVTLTEERRALTREQALIQVVLAQSEVIKDYQARVVRMLALSEAGFGPLEPLEYSPGLGGPR